MAKKENNVFNNSFVINDNHGSITEPKIINYQTINESSDLRTELLNFLEELEENINIPPKTKRAITEQTGSLIADLENGTASKNRLKQFHHFLHESLPELQLTATCSGLISALADVLK